MIRFCCTKCGKDYLLADALARLPLLCKGCGDRIIVPDPSESLPEPPPPPPKPISVPPSQVAPEQPDRNHEPAPSAPAGEVDLFLSEELRKKLTVPMEESGREPAPMARVAAKPETPAPDQAEESQPDRARLARIVDGAVLLVVLVIGMFIGESVAGKSTLKILGDAPASPKFPPTDLLVWLACVVVLGLVYLWLGTRGWSVGGWIKRR